MIKPWMIPKAEENNISMPTLRYRLKAGWDEEKACTYPVKDQSERKKWLTYAEQKGMTRRMFDYRVYEKGMTFEQAVNTPRFQVARNGRKKWLEKARKNGLSESAFCNRVYNLGWTMKEASERPKYYREKKAKPIDDRYTIYKKMAVEEGLSVAEFNRRIFDEGMSLEEAIH